MHLRTDKKVAFTSELGSGSGMKLKFGMGLNRIG